MTGGPRLAVDTSVAVPLLVATHEAHASVAAWAAGRTLVLCGHALAETYSVLTRLPGGARVAPSDAVRLIDESFAKGLALSEDGVAEVHRVLADRGVAGGATYDGLVGLTAREHDVVLATRDARARSTYEAIGVAVEVVPDAGEPRPVVRRRSGRA